MTVEYIATLERLAEVSLADLGPIDEGTFDSYLERAAEVATAQGVSHPRLVVEVDFKPGAHDFLEEFVGLLYADHYDAFAVDGERMCENMPRVHVIDGDKYTADI